MILVRDEQQKDDLRSQIGDIALVLTILQNKGMEFDDVILCDFFTNFPSDAGLRKLVTLFQGGRGSFDVVKYGVSEIDGDDGHVLVTDEE